MNKIDFHKVPFTDANGRKLGDNLVMTIDGVIPGKYGNFDPIEFVSATLSLGKYQRTYFYACTCGDTGCAGYHLGVYLKYRRHTVEWRDLDSPLQMTQRFYSFDLNEYRAAIAKCMTLLFEIAKEQDSIKKEILAADELSEEIEDYYMYNYFITASSESEILGFIQRRQKWNKQYRLL